MAKVPPSSTPPAKASSAKVEGSGDVMPTAYQIATLNGRMLFGDSIEIDISKRLPQYSNQYISAYLGKSLGSEAKTYLVYVCEPPFTPRNRVGPSYASVANPSLLRLIGSGIAKIAEHKINRFVFIYENSLGKPLATTDSDLAMGMKSDRVLDKVFTPLLGVLRDLRDADIVHGGIRVSNIFDGGKENFDYVVLGECLSLPPSMAQPSIYEPTDRAQASPTGRGIGSNQDDLYALGVSLALMLRTRDPMRGKTEAEILQSKIQYGTLTTLMSPDDHFQNSVMELLRGLLQDDRKQRWTLDETLAWQDGRRQPPKQGTKKLRASRPLSFNGKTYSVPSLLARDMFLKPTEAVHLIESGEIQQWIKRSLDDEPMFLRFESALKSADDGGRNSVYFDKLVARVGICLDPEGPIRFKNMSITGEGLATSLAEAFVLNKDLSIYSELFTGGLLSYWLTVLTDLNVDVTSFVSRIEASRSFMRQPGMGFGLERVLYYLNPDVHCLSPSVSRYYARSPEELLMALDDLAADKAARPVRIMDRHIVAFLCVKDRKMAEPYIYDLSSNEPFRNVLGTLQSLAAIQRFSKIQSVRNVSNWMADIVEPLYDRFHDRDTRKDLRKKVSEIRDKGDLPRLLALLDNPEALNNDLTNFKRAMQMYKTLIIERNDLSARVADIKNYGRREGRETAIVITGVVSVLLLVGVIVLYMNGARIL